MQHYLALVGPCQAIPKASFPSRDRRMMIDSPQRFARSSKQIEGRTQAEVDASQKIIFIPRKSSSNNQFLHYLYI